MIKTVRILLRKLVSDKRGDDASNPGMQLTRAGAVGITAMALTGLAAGTATLTNNGSRAGDTTSSAINGVVGASAGHTDDVSSPFSKPK